MSRRAAVAVVVATATERRILDTLAKILPAAAASYEQCVIDFGGPSRYSYRGVAHELREVLRESLEYLAPDAEVMAESGFKLEQGVNRPTQRQKALHILRKRKLSREASAAPELAVSMVEELGAAITRSAYTRGSRSAHVTTSSSEVRQLKMYVDAVLAELLEIYAE
ncbi:MAG: hypothetical protein AB7L09_04980 [Nitrospira sp.]